MYKVLIVDDCKSDLRGLQKYISWEKFECEIVAAVQNGQEGYNAAIKYKPDIVITDISMPVKDGFEMTNLINAQMKNVFYIYMSCHQSFMYAQLAIKNRACAYILKPIRKEEMEDALNKAIASIKSDFNKTNLIERLNKQIEENKYILCENYLLNILLGKEDDKAKCEILEISYDKKYRVGITVIDDMQDDFNDIYIQRMFLKECLSNVFNTGYFLIFENDKLIMLLEETDDIFVLLERVQSDFKEAFGKTVSMFINSYCDVLLRLKEQFHTMYNIIKNNFFDNREQIIVTDEAFPTKYENEIIMDIPKAYEDITNTLKKKMEVEELLNRYFPEGNTVNRSYIKSSTYCFVCSVCIFLTSQNYSLSNIFKDEMVIWQKIKNIDSILNIRQWVINIISAVDEFLSYHVISDKSKDVAENIKYSIDSGFSSNTVLEDSAGKQNISLYHANVIFKQCYNVTMFEYLVDKRIEEAKRLLTDTNKKIYEIGESIGYSSNTYFSTAFKKNIGMSPQQYRDRSILGRKYEEKS